MNLKALVTDPSEIRRRIVVEVIVAGFNNADYIGHPPRLGVEANGGRRGGSCDVLRKLVHVDHEVLAIAHLNEIGVASQWQLSHDAREDGRTS
jgi:hypothetical protein